MLFRSGWLYLLAVQGTFRSRLQYHSSKASILKRRGTATPVHHPQRPVGSTQSSTMGLRPPDAACLPGSVHSLCPPHEDLPAPPSEVSARGSALGANSPQLQVPAQFPGPYLSLPSSGLARGAWRGLVQRSLLVLCSSGAPTLLPCCLPQPNLAGISPASPSKVFLWLWEEPGSRLLIPVTVQSPHLLFPPCLCPPFSLPLGCIVCAKH